MQLKQRALVPVILGMVGLAVYAFHHLMWTSGAEAWHGAFLAAAALPTYMALFLAKGGAARTSSLLVPVQIVTGIGVFLAATETGALIAALLSFAGLQWFVFVYSRYGRTKSDAIIIGKPLPEVAFEDLDGARVTSDDFLGAATLLVFFRGNWCPLCMAQLRELRARADQLANANVQVRFISNQSAEKSMALATKLDLPLHFQILRDRNMLAADRLGIADIGGAPVGLKGYPKDTVMATVIALDARGQVLFGDETDNYRVRPHPDLYLPLLEQAGDAPEVTGTSQIAGAA
ncbi:MAG: redoxin domain-containing protein [Pseudomonadota bacterium]